MQSGWSHSRYPFSLRSIVQSIDRPKKSLGCAKRTDIGHALFLCESPRIALMGEVIIDVTQTDSSGQVDGNEQQRGLT